MPLHFINDPSLNRWGNIGSEFAGGLSQGLQYLAQQKLDQMAQANLAKQQEQAYENLGIPKAFAKALPHVSEKERATFLSGWAQTQPQAQLAQQQLQTARPAGVSAQQAREMNMQQGYEPIPEPQKQNLIQQLASSAKPASIGELLAAVSPNGKGLAGLGGTGQGFGPQLPTPPQELLREQARAEARQAPENRIPLQATQPSFANIYAAGAKTPAEKIAERKLEYYKERDLKNDLKERVKENKGNQDKIDSETKPYREQIKKEAKVAKNNDRRLDRMEQLNEKGYLGVPLFNSLIKTASKGIFGLSLDLTNLMTADAQELDKLSTDFIKDAKEIFGNRLTDADLNAFLRTVPTLSQSKEGRTRIINNLKFANEAAKIREKALSEILKDNNGRSVRDIDDLVEKVAGPKIDKLSESFKYGTYGKVNPAPESLPNAILQGLNLAY